MKVTHDGLIAGERFLRERCAEFNDGTVDGTHWLFIRDLLSAALRASDIALEMPSMPPDAPAWSSLEAPRDTLLLQVCATGFDGEDFGSSVLVRRD